MLDVRPERLDEPVADGKSSTSIRHRFVSEGSIIAHYKASVQLPVPGRRLHSVEGCIAE